MQPSTAAPAQRRDEKCNAFNDRAMNDSLVRVRQVLSATPARAFQAWLDPALAGRGLFATASRPMTRVAIDARSGGRFRFADEGGAEESGCYLEILPERRLGLSLDRSCSTVTVEFGRHDAGCLLSLTHCGLLSEYADYVQARWEGMLYGLGMLLESEDVNVCL